MNYRSSTVQLIQAIFLLPRFLANSSFPVEAVNKWSEVLVSKFVVTQKLACLRANHRPSEHETNRRHAECPDLVKTISSAINWLCSKNDCQPHYTGQNAHLHTTSRRKRFRRINFLLYMIRRFLYSTILMYLLTAVEVESGRAFRLEADSHMCLV